MKKFIQFLKDKSGAISVEFAMISPMLIFSTLYSANMGVKVHEHQKVASAVSAGTMYLQDYTLQKDLRTLRPNFDDLSQDYVDSTPVNFAKNMIKNAYGDDLPLEAIQIDTMCACKAPNQDPEGTLTEVPYDFEDQNTTYYNKQSISYSRTGELCPFNCPGENGRARVLVEINVYHKTADFFSDDVLIAETVTTRLR